VEHYSKHILVIRLSALGDATMVAPVLRQFAEHCPQVKFTMVSRPLLQPLFAELPNLEFIGVDVYGHYKGLAGLWKLFRFLQSKKPDVVADLHDVLRTKIVRALFKISGTRIYYIHKGRPEKRALCRRKNKVKKPLKTTFERYWSVLKKATGAKLPPGVSYSRPAYADTIVEVEGTAIGIAPFAGHKGKIYPLEKMEQVVAYFAVNKGINVVLLGSPGEEQSFLEQWAYRYPNVQSLAGKVSLYEELAVMEHLPVIITMDSANLHFASFVNTPVVSVWGATHPHAGFYGWQQLPEHAVSVDLPCRPCSIYGNKPCYREDYHCLHAITPMEIIQKVETILNRLN